MEVFLSKFGWIVTGIVAGIVWLVRLEAVALANRQEIKRLWNQRAEDLRSAKEARDESNKMLSEIRQDVKDLLRKGS